MTLLDEQAPAPFEVFGEIGVLFHWWQEAQAAKDAGLPRDAWPLPPREVLCDGPAGTGKTRTIVELLHRMLCANPGMRVLFVRKTKVSLAQSVLVTFEEEVLRGDEWRDAIIGNRTRAGRESYKYPNGSEIVLGGMDNYTRLFSTQYDVIFINEANECALEEAEALHRALRNGRGPFHMLLMDCNPDSYFHWLNQRCTDLDKVHGKTHRLKTWLKDNPRFYDHSVNDWTPEGRAYDDGLRESLSGFIYDRLYGGIWVAAQGTIFDNWDPDVHIRDRHEYFGKHLRELSSWSYQTNSRFSWFFASMDWGHVDPGSLAVWGVTDDQQMVLVEQHMHPYWLIDDWVDLAVQIHDQYELRRIVCDSARPDCIALLNARLSRDGRGMSAIGEPEPEPLAVGVSKTSSHSKGFKWAAINHFKFGLQKSHLTGGPRIVILRDSMRSADTTLERQRRPVSFEQEILQYVWAKQDPDKPVKEEPDELCSDHLMDAAIYAWWWLDDQDLSDPEDRPRFEPGSLGHMLQHETVGR